MSRMEKQVQRVLDLWRQATAERLTRRDAYKMGLTAGAAGLFANRKLWAASGSGSGGSGSSGSGGDIQSPPTTPFKDRMPVPPVLAKKSAFATKEPHQYYNGYFPKTWYTMQEKENQQFSFHSDLPLNTIWGFNGKFPGPTIDMRYGEPVLLKIKNNLPPLNLHTGFGIPQCVEHLHNGHTASESDGGPWRWTNPGQTKYYHHCMARAGFTNPTLPGPDGEDWRDGNEPAGGGYNYGGGDLRETLTTLFLHYHRPEFTADGVYKGIVNIVRFFDKDDSGDETDGNSWQLPSGNYDIPLVLADKQFDPGGELIFDQFNLDGFLGDKFTVNGKIQPYFPVKQRKYRFRVLDGGPARLYNLVLRHNGKTIPFTQITDNGNLLEKPKTINNLEIWVADRHDIIIDFGNGQFKNGDRVYLANTLVMKDGRGPDVGKVANPDQVENQLVEFRVTGKVTDVSKVPSTFRPFAPVIIPDNVVRRHWRFERGNGMWQVNGELWDPDVDHREPQLSNPDTQILRDASEIWTIQNNSGGWVHPVHIHLEEGQILKINGNAPSAAARARKDVYHLAHNTEIEIFLRFRDYPEHGFIPAGEKVGEYTRYPMHCHNMTHEDHAMMKTWNVVEEPTT